MQVIRMPHPVEDALERFAMKRSEDSELEEVESHILGCPACLDRVLDLESFVEACRGAFPEFQREQALFPVKAKPRSGFWRLGWPMLKWSWAPALAVLALLGVVVPNLPLRQPAGASVEATLSASRGTDSGALLPARSVIRLHLDAIDLPAGALQIELVNGEGRSLWSRGTSAQADRIDVETPRLQPGVYFARLYPMQGGHPDKDHLLREFAFQVR